MNINFEIASIKDIDKIIEVRNKSFYNDFIKYGECPGYNCSIEAITAVVNEKYVFMIKCNDNIVGNISVGTDNKANYFLNCLCVIPEYENIGIGQKAMHFIENRFSDAKHWSLETPADKHRNHYFYKKLGYQITKQYIENTVEIVLLEKWCNPRNVHLS